jgi:hypothetical protein
MVQTKKIPQQRDFLFLQGRNLCALGIRVFALA